TTPTYVVTGIPLNANILDLIPLTDHLNARSIEFLPTKPVSLHKVANIYCNTDDDNHVQFTKFDTNFQGFQLHIYPAQKFNLNDTCGFCGKENHNVYDCSETDYTIIPHNKERKYRKKFLKRQNAYTLNDNVKLSYDQIKPLMSSQRNRPNLHGRHNTRPSPNQGYQTKTPNNSTFAPRDKRYNRGPVSHSTIIPDNDMNNWDVNPNNSNTNKPTIKAATISGVPKIVSFLENLEQNGFFSQFNDNNQAYGSNNYSYPPHDEFVTEEHLQEEYNDSQSGYESSNTVETHNVFPDTDYTPSRPTGGYPTITSSISNKFGNMLGLGHRQQ
ncbi:3201_t:CDS:2, partial [Rhizophagus irregularis]